MSDVTKPIIPDFLYGQKPSKWLPEKFEEHKKEGKHPEVAARLAIADYLDLLHEELIKQRPVKI